MWGVLHPCGGTASVQKWKASQNDAAFLEARKTCFQHWTCHFLHQYILFAFLLLFLALSGKIHPVLNGLKWCRSNTYFLCSREILFTAPFSCCNEVCACSSWRCWRQNESVRIDEREVGYVWIVFLGGQGPLFWWLLDERGGRSADPSCSCAASLACTSANRLLQVPIDGHNVRRDSLGFGGRIVFHGQYMATIN